MSILVIADFFVEPDKIEEFLALLREVLPDTRGFEGCERLDTYVNQDEPGHVRAVETWGARSDHKSYLRWRRETRMMDTLAPYAVAPPRFAYYDARPEV